MGRKREKEVKLLLEREPTVRIGGCWAIWGKLVPAKKIHA
jgi:hypothetical protein